MYGFLKPANTNYIYYRSQKNQTILFSQCLSSIHKKYVTTMQTIINPYLNLL